MKGLAIEVSAHQTRQCCQLLGRFLHHKQIGPMLPDQASDILDTRADKPEQIPTDNSEPLTRSIMDRLGIKKNLLARCAIVGHHSNFGLEPETLELGSI